MTTSLRIYLKKFFRVLGIFLLALVALIVLVTLALQFPAVQNKLADIAVRKLQQKLHTEVRLGRIRVILPNSVTVKNLYIADQENDTLLDAGLIRVNVGLFGLLKKKVNIRLLELRDITGHISRPAGDSAFNFSFIPEAFSSGSSSPPADTAGSSSMSFSLGRIVLSGIRLSYEDHLTGNDVKADIGQFSVSFRKFNLSPLAVGVGKVEMKNSSARLVLSGSSSSGSGSSSPDISLHSPVRLSDISFFLEDRSTGQKTDIRHADLQFNPKTVSLSDGIINLRRIRLQHAVVDVSAGTSGSQAAGTASASGSSFGWKISVGRLLLGDNSFTYDVDTVARHPRQVDFSHLGMRNISGIARDIAIGDGWYKGGIDQFSFVEQSGFTLSNLSG